MKFLTVIVLILAIYLSNHGADSLTDTIGNIGIESFEWICKTLSEDGDVLITISTEANPDLIDSLAHEFGRTR